MAIAQLLSRPVAGSVTRSGMPASPRPLNADHIEFSATASAPFWARQQTRFFLGHCRFDRDVIETAQMVVSELTTNAFNAAGNHSTDRPVYSELVKTGVIGLSLRHFPHGLLVEVIDASPEPPILTKPDAYSEHGRGVWTVAALSREWGYFHVHHGKCVYSILDIPG
jgi:anti-sigma regulatory factor (Ser/Thr protein kinase)